MKPHITPLQRERVLREEDFIVSKTDAKGRITYANRIFMEFAGYPERELLGVQHNLIRHPDMPRAVFKMMWETVQAGREFFGYVKNLASDGSYYWTFANVTPAHDPKGETRVISRYAASLAVRRSPSCHRSTRRCWPGRPRWGRKPRSRCRARFWRPVSSRKA